MSNSKAYIWTFIGKFGSQAIGLIHTMILARILTPDDFGIVGVISIIFVIANTLVDSGLGGALMMEEELNKVNCGTIFVFNAVVSLLLYFIVFISAPYIESFYRISGLTSVTRVLSLVFVVNSFGIVPIGVMSYKLSFKTLSIIGLISVLIAAVVSIVLAILGVGVYSLVAFQLTYSTLNVIVLLVLNKEYLSLEFDKKVFIRMFSFGFYTTISNIVDSIYENFITVIFGKMLTVTDAGYVAQSKKIEDTASQSLMLTINSTSYPILSKIKDQIILFQQESYKLLKNVPLLITPVLIVLCVFSKEIIQILLGNQWIPASRYLSIFAVAGFFIILDVLNRNFIKSLGKVKILFFTTLLKRVIGFTMIILVAFVAPQFTLYAYVVGAFIGFACNHYVYTRLIHIRAFYSFFKTLKNLMPIILLTIVLSITYNLIDHIILKIVFSTIIILSYYIVLLPYLGIPILKILGSIVRK